jgi:hypothetical protein
MVVGTVLLVIVTPAHGFFLPSEYWRSATVTTNSINLADTSKYGPDVVEYLKPLGKQGLRQSESVMAAEGATKALLN